MPSAFLLQDQSGTVCYWWGKQEDIPKGWVELHPDTLMTISLTFTKEDPLDRLKDIGFEDAARSVLSVNSVEVGDFDWALDIE